MKKPFNLLLLAVLAIFQLSCSNDDDNNEASLNSKSVTDCGELTVSPTGVQVCMTGAEFALPNETITYAAEYNSNLARFTWTIISGDMEIINIEYSATDGISKSIATVKFNPDFNGNGVIKMLAEDSKGSGVFKHEVALEKTN